ncbi:hypothetical protein EH240_14440 [Mesorhizobium tamadayense]|uniref:Nucleotidyl transferase AbiEii/AbiGii toxin family protein n=1 Tax=Mesorhizobium tamadayense TaxID=425306 RepID=A0A3P3FSH7_9HYPH|nr:hypothetical protein [Mesorhizobium tamadayense]RRI01498.1 hypothetical protein EH240_14440 [Mesorhizobium tamadayense]
MVKGIERFAEHFAGFEEQYAVIGGAACDLLFDDVGLQFRGTKDIDMVVCVEVVELAFAERFGSFLDAGGYEAREHGDGKRQFYRFHKPKDDTYPYMLELFTRRQEVITLPESAVVTRIVAEDDAASLSAILLDDDYYAAIAAARRVVSGVSIIDESLLIPFKARAFLDLSTRAAAGEKIDSKTIKKHRNDIVRLSQLLVADVAIDFGETIRNDMRRFLKTIEEREDVDTKSLGLKAPIQEVLARLRLAYGI